MLTTASKEALAGKGGIAKGDTTPNATAPKPTGQKKTAAPKPSQPTSTAIPKDIANQISKMTPANKQKLVGMLQ